MAEYFAKNRLNISIEYVSHSVVTLHQGLCNPITFYYLFTPVSRYISNFSLINSIVITTGHMSGGHLNEKQWMDQRPEIRDRAKVAIVCEHFGAIEWKDSMKDGKPVYEATGLMEPMWTMVYVPFSCSQILCSTCYNV